jgi:hypothetical protein
VSRQKLRLDGRLLLLRHDAVGPTPVVEVSDGSMVVCDPRVVVRNRETGEVVHTPRDVPLNDHVPWVRQWLVAHPAWGRRPGPSPTLLGMDRRDKVHQHKARCGRCRARCWLGPRQHAMLVEAEGDAGVLCPACTARDIAMGVSVGLAHLGNPDLYDGDKWPPGEVRVLSPGPSRN